MHEWRGFTGWQWGVGTLKQLGVNLRECGLIHSLHEYPANLHLDAA
jgi:hypothetical protein